MTQKHCRAANYKICTRNTCSATCLHVYVMVKLDCPVGWLQHDTVGECEKCADPMLLAPVAWPPSQHNSSVIVKTSQHAKDDAKALSVSYPITQILYIALQYPSKLMCAYLPFLMPYKGIYYTLPPTVSCNCKSASLSHLVVLFPAIQPSHKVPLMICRLFLQGTYFCNSPLLKYFV